MVVPRAYMPGQPQTTLQLPQLQRCTYESFWALRNMRSEYNKLSLAVLYTPTLLALGTNDLSLALHVSQLSYMHLTFQSTALCRLCLHYILIPFRSGPSSSPHDLHLERPFRSRHNALPPQHQMQIVTDPTYGSYSILLQVSQYPKMLPRSGSCAVKGKCGEQLPLGSLDLTNRELRSLD